MTSCDYGYRRLCALIDLLWLPDDFCFDFYIAEYYKWLRLPMCRLGNILHRFLGQQPTLDVYAGAKQYPVEISLISLRVKFLLI